MGGSLRIVTIRGIPISLHASWLAIYALITWTLAVGYFPRALPDLAPIAYWTYGLIAALLLFVSVLLHELAHSFVATAYGLRVHGITLHVFGGVSSLEDEPPSATAELLIAAAGPLMSFLIAGLLWGIGVAGLMPAGSVGAVADYLLVVNASIGVFNLIPGYPLDGGRLLRAAMWRWTGSLTRATVIASRSGRFFALALMMLGGFEIAARTPLTGFWLILLGFFLKSAAEASQQRLVLQETLAPIAVRDVMTRDVIAVSPEMTLAEVAARFWEHHVTSFPVVDDRPRGIVTIDQLRQIARDRWNITRVADVMRPLADTLVVRADDSVFDALGKASANGVGRVAVLEESQLVGYLSLKDIAHAAALAGPHETAALARSTRRAA